MSKKRYNKATKFFALRIHRGGTMESFLSKSRLQQTLNKVKKIVRAAQAKKRCNKNISKQQKGTKSSSCARKERVQLKAF